MSNHSLGSDSHTPSGGGGTGKGGKTGRKGDPRMHRAVSARLTDPNATLYHALIQGGFDYPRDDDAGAVDDEGVTLGQRKNQLSRRLRLAKKDPTGSGSPSGAAGSSAWRASVKQDMAEKSKQMKQLAGQKRGLYASNVDDNQEHIMAKFHPDYNPAINMGRGGGKALTAPRTSHNSSSLQSVNAPLMPTPPAVLHNHQHGFDLRLAQAQQQQQQQQQHETALLAAAGLAPPSGVAVASLQNTAHKAGMTLEQLALTLNQHNNLVALLNSANSPDKQKNLALGLYQTEISSLYTKAMLLSGYSGMQAAEGSQTYMEFALSAWQAEGQRLQELLNDRPDNDMDVASTQAANEAANRSPSAHQHDHDHGNGHNHGNGGTAGTGGGGAVTVGHDCTLDGRHIHRLEGKCGHRAVVHQPANGGSAHIDFVVGDKIECYQNLPSLHPKQANGATLWPSKYNCKDLSCAADCSYEPLAEHRQRSECSAEFQQNNNPKILELETIDLDSKEWNHPLSDESIMGLFRLQTEP